MGALYNTGWYEQNREYRRNFFILQNACARPVQVKILGMHAVKIDSITVTLKRVYTTLQVLIKTIK